jgi:hypothetical protein
MKNANAGNASPSARAETGVQITQRGEWTRMHPTRLTPQPQTGAAREPNDFIARHCYQSEYRPAAAIHVG